MRGIPYPLESFDELSALLDAGGEEQDMSLPPCDGLREGEWLLVSFNVGDETTAVAGCVVDSSLTAPSSQRALCGMIPP